MEHIKVIYTKNIHIGGCDIPFIVGALDSHARSLVEVSIDRDRYGFEECFTCDVKENVVIFEDIVHVCILWTEENILESRRFLLGDLKGNPFLQLERFLSESGIRNEKSVALNILSLSRSDTSDSLLAPELYYSWMNDMKSGVYKIQPCLTCLDRINDSFWTCSSCPQHGRLLKNKKCWNCQMCPECEHEEVVKAQDEFWGRIVERNRTRTKIKKEICLMLLAQKHCPPELTLPKDIQGVIAEMITWEV